MKILFLSRWYPYPPSNGSKLRILNLLRGLRSEHQLTLFTLADDVVDEPPLELSAICERVVSFARPTFDPRATASLLGLFSSVPRSLVATHHAGFADAVRREIEVGQYDLVIASQWAMAPYVLDVPSVPAIFEEVELGLFTSAVDAAQSPAIRLRRWLTVWKLGRYLRQILPRFAACTVASEVEAGLVRRLAPGHLVVVTPNGVDVGSYQHVVTSPRPQSMIFTGALSYSANYEAAQWFLSEVLPLIRERRPDAHVTVTGDPGDRTLPGFAGVQFSGFVDDVRPLVASAWVSVVPLLSGGGTRLKMLEAMALRTPVVATRKGAEGLDVVSGRDVLLADTPQAFADAVVRVLEDRSLREDLAERAFEVVSSRYDWSVILPGFLNLVKDSVYGQESVTHRRRGRHE